MPKRITIAKSGKRYEYDRQYRLQSDYLKYYRVIRYYICRRYKISEMDLELLLFLRGEKYFTKREMEQWKDILGWNRMRTQRLVQEGWVEVFRKAKVGRWNAIYHVTYKAQMMMTVLYDIIEMRKLVRDRDRTSALFKSRNITFSDQVYAREIKKMTAYNRAYIKAHRSEIFLENTEKIKAGIIQRQRRRAPESPKTSPRR